MTVEWTISIGAIVAGVFNTLAIFAAAVGFYYATKFHNKIVTRELSILGGRMINVENEMRELTKVMTVQAVQASEIATINVRLAENEREIQEWQKWVREKLDRLEERSRGSR